MLLVPLLPVVWAVAVLQLLSVLLLTVYDLQGMSARIFGPQGPRPAVAFIVSLKEDTEIPLLPSR